MYIPLAGTATNGSVMLDQLVTIDYNARDFKFVEKVPPNILETLLQIVPLVFQPN
jgi:mRNA interferase MazF